LIKRCYQSNFEQCEGSEFGVIAAEMAITNKITGGIAMNEREIVNQVTDRVKQSVREASPWLIWLGRLG
jgi:hypothetical protein